MEDLRSDALLSNTTEVKGYKILPPCVLYARIGVGGMGAVYRGHHLNLDIEVAVKCLKPSLVEDDPTFVDRFKREGRSAAKINHQNVIRVFDVQENLGLHYLIMEYVAGETVRQRVERKGALQLPEALQIVYEASLGLGEAHRMGIIHRDVKPDNLLISTRGQVKVADLGLAKPAVSSAQSVLSMAGQVMGTPPYMPPEQWGEGTVTTASDVWAMGAVLYYLLTGREAISGESLAAIMSKIVLQDFPDLREILPDIPDTVMEVLNKATAKAPGHRYLDAYELADAIGKLPQHRISLADADAGTTELVTMLSPPPSARINEIKKLLGTRTSTPSEATRESTPETPSAAKGGRLPWVAVLLVLLLAGGGGAGYFYRDLLFGKDPAKVTPEIVDLLAPAKQLQTEGKFVAALVAARAVIAGDPSAMEALVEELKPGVRTELNGSLQKVQPSAEVAKGEEVTFRVRFEGSGVEGSGAEVVIIGGTEATPTGDAFEAKLTPPENGIVTVRVRITKDDTFDLDDWVVTFKKEEPVLAPVTFAGTLTTEPKLGERKTTDLTRVVLVGQASEKDLELILGGQVLGDVRWENDRTFKVTVDIPKEGRNTIELTVRRSGETEAQATAQQIRSIEIVRLTEQPTIALVSPSKETSDTPKTELILEVTTDEWTKSVTATAKAGDQTIEFAKAGTTGDQTKWCATTPLQLGDNEITAEIIAINLTGKVRKQPLTITCTATPLEIPEITLSVGINDFKVAENQTFYVNRQPALAAKLNDPKVKLIVNDKTRENKFRPNLREGQSKAYELRAEKGLRRSKSVSFTIVYDTKKPTFTVDKPPAAKANTDITLKGKWKDDFGIASIETTTGAKAQLNTPGTSGEWSIPVRVGKNPTTFQLIATDLAGNRREDSKPITVLLEPESIVKLSTKINRVLFTAVGDLNQKGFPPELVHKTTGIQLVAINFGNAMAPSLYIAKRVVSKKEWDGNGGSDPMVSVRWLTVYRKVEESRFEGLDLVTRRQWITAKKDAGLITGRYLEWLAYDAAADGKGSTRGMVDKKLEIISFKIENSNSSLGFRVGFAPE